MERYKETGNLLIIEVWLDLAYYRKLLALIRSLRGKDKEEAKRFLGVMVDGQSILWAFRYRIHYQLSPEEILNYSLLDGINVDYSTIQSIAQGASVEDIIRQTWGRDFPGISTLNGLSDREALPQLERILMQYLFSQAKQVQNSYAMHLGIALGFDFLVETEVRDLITIAEGKAIGLPSERIQPYLISLEG
jgi:vacuolar-type H+-ATPase subunit C/Vma6